MSQENIYLFVFEAVISVIKTTKIFRFTVITLLRATVIYR